MLIPYSMNFKGFIVFADIILLMGKPHLNLFLHALFSESSDPKIRPASKSCMSTVTQVLMATEYWSDMYLTS